jgi:hypothetical protein
MQTRPTTDLPPVAKEYNGVDRNAFLFGWNPQPNCGMVAWQ